MPNLTINYGLKKPLPEEFYDVNVQNENMDIIDEELKNRIPSLATYYQAISNKNADELIDSFALIPVSSSVNAELFNIVGGTFAWVWTNFYLEASVTARRMQVAMSYNTIEHKMAFRIYGANGWLEWKELAVVGHNHSVDNITGTLPISKGGTGATDAATARTNLEITPANIGAASNTNPKFTGGVTLNEIVGLVVNADGIAELTIKHKTEQGNSRKLYVAPSDTVEDLKSAIMLGDEYRGLTRLYKLYGDHNTTVETWTFTLEDGSTVTKAVYVG